MTNAEPMTKEKAAAMKSSDLLNDVLFLAEKGFQLKELRTRQQSGRFKSIWLDGPLVKAVEANGKTMKDKAALASASARKKRDEELDETTEEFIERMDNLTLDPAPLGPMCRRMLASGWDFSGFREKDAKSVRGFVMNEDLWPLSEADLSVAQRRYWRTIKTKFRRYLQGK